MADRGPITDERQAVWWHRYNEAREYGLSHEDASAFAESDQDVGLLRKLVGEHCDPTLIGRIVR